MFAAERGSEQDGTAINQKFEYRYNDLGKVTNFIDPTSRNFTFVHAANGIDLLEGSVQKVSHFCFRLRKVQLG